MKFCEEPKNKAVTTTRYVMDANSLITYVVYDEEGEWHFFSDEDSTESDVCLISVSDILALDDSLSTLDLKSGQGAERSDADSAWQTVRIRSIHNPLSFDEDDN